MRRQIRDGWHIVCGYEVYVEDGCILRGISGNGSNQKPTYPYRACRHGGWDNAYGITVSAFRSAFRRGTVRMI